MAESEARRWGWRASSWWLLAGPLAVLLAANVLIGLFGYPLSDGPLSSGEDQRLHTQIEASARLKVLSTWLLTAAASVVAVCYFAVGLSRFQRKPALKLLAVASLLGLIGVLLVLRGISEEGHRYVGELRVCAAFGGTAEADPTRPALPARVPHTVRPQALTPPIHCRSEQMAQLRGFNLALRLLLALATAAVVVGAVSCLQAPRAGTGSQAERLTNYLYIAAALMVSGLLFLSALLRWPAVSLSTADAAAYRTHVDAVVLYWGVAYSLLNASWYVPAAAVVKADKLIGPADLAKKALAVFAPAIAGLLDGVMKLS
jgi:hypothetical protein